MPQCEVPLPACLPALPPRWKFAACQAQIRAMRLRDG